MVTRPALGIEAAPTDARVAVRLNRVISRFVEELSLPHG